MASPVYVIGHKNPDTDSIASAIAYAHLHQEAHGETAIPVRQGDPWKETRYVLERMEIEMPIFLEDIYPRVKDAMNYGLVSVTPDAALMDAGRLMRLNSIRTMPVVDGEGYLHGMISISEFSHILLEGLNPEILDQVPLKLPNIVAALNARVLYEAKGRHIPDRVQVAAMSFETLERTIKPDAVLIVSDRIDVQKFAIQNGAAALIVTGGMTVRQDVLQLARDYNVTVISSPHRTFPTLRLLSVSIPVSYVMQKNVLTTHPSDLLDDTRQLLTQQLSLPVLDNSDRVIGVLSRTDMLHPVRYRVVLVDHNERSQAIAGLERADVIGIIDHHRVADIQTMTPVLFRNEPVGCTCTILTKMYEEANVEIPPTLAGLMLAAIVTDTVMFRSPTSTSRDKKAAEKLAKIAELDIEAFAQDIFNAAMVISKHTAEEILTNDFKEFRIGGRLYGVAYLETTNKRQLLERRDELLEFMQQSRKQSGYETFIFIVVDILRGETELLFYGRENDVTSALNESALPIQHHTVEHNSLTISTVISRKKQIVPLLPRIGNRQI